MKNINFFFSLFLILIHFCAYSQKPVFNTSEWTRKQHREEMARISIGHVDEAVDNLQTFLKSHPDDPETFFVLAVAYTQKKDYQQALTYVRKSLDAGLPFERFLSGPKILLKSLYDQSEFRKLNEQYQKTLIHGPMLGAVTDHSARIWVRTAKEMSVKVLVNKTGDSTNQFESPEGRTSEDHDFTTVIFLDGLSPVTSYRYQLKVDGSLYPEIWTFQTMPEKGKSAGFKIGFGGGAAYTPPNEKMWSTIKDQALAGFLFLGDNVYIDHPELPAVQQFCYYQRQSRPEYRAFIAETPIYAIWDDHDFVTNDGWGGPEINSPSWKIPVWQLFQDNWNNPNYGLGAKQPGCWFKFSIADVDFFMLDCRFYRTDPKSDNLSMLGPVQLKWLLDELKASHATFKVLASSVPWASGTKGGSLDTWDGYSAERNEIFDHITQNKIEGILLLSADRHRSDLWKIFRPAGYHLYEFESSCLTNIHRHETLPGAIFSYNEKPSFGLLEFNTMLSDPEVNYQIVNIENNIVFKFKIFKSQLKIKSPEQLEWEKRLQEDDILNPAFVFVKDDPALPRVLIIGNSISIGFTPFVREFLAGKVNVHRIPENARDTNFGLQRLSEWVGQTKWDIIHFNWGLHDLKRLKDGKYDVTGEQVTPLQQYKENMEELVRQLKNTGATLIWASTTPVQSGSSGRIEGNEIKYNQVAEKIMKRHNILINDLHTCILPYLKEYQKPQNVHFTETGSRFLGQKVAETIQQVLLK